MVYAYGWATLDPLRKILYNFFITAASICVAFILGLIETFQVIQQADNLTGGFWDWIAAIDFGDVGFAVIGIFVFMFLLSMVVYRYQRIDIQVPSPTSSTFSKMFVLSHSFSQSYLTSLYFFSFVFPCFVTP
jgi:high-affinity nickel-transport protein